MPELVAPEDVARAKELLEHMLVDADLEAHGTQIRTKRARYVHFGPMLEYDPFLLDVAAYPAIVSRIEDLVGGEVRLEETEAIVNGGPDDAQSDRRYHPTGFHRGISPEVSCFARDGKLHHLWVKALILLSDVGRETGGTVMVRGSHRLPHVVEDVRGWWDDSLVAQAFGPAGSVLFMSEATIHSTSLMLSDTTRYTLINGYTPPWMQAWPGYDPSPEFADRQTPEMRRFLLGESRYGWGVR